MKPSSACFQARLETFGSERKPKSKAKSRRPSRSKKTSTGSVVSNASDELVWPLSSPKPFDLAFAGFEFKPTSTSPDNVQCFSCNCQLDGWEPTDVPAFEHLTHSPTCGWAINTCIRLRLGDPDRVEEDPMCEKMIAARRATFADYWNFDTSNGFPTVDQVSTTLSPLPQTRMVL
jgi:hypothetical protein